MKPLIGIFVCQPGVLDISLQLDRKILDVAWILVLTTSYNAGEAAQ